MVNENTKKSRKRRGKLAELGLKELRGLIVTEKEEAILKPRFKEELRELREGKPEPDGLLSAITPNAQRKAMKVISSGGSLPGLNVIDSGGVKGSIDRWGRVVWESESDQEAAEDKYYRLMTDMAKYFWFLDNGRRINVEDDFDDHSLDSRYYEAAKDTCEEIRNIRKGT